MKNIASKNLLRLTYYAQFKEWCGKPTETIHSNAKTAGQLLKEISSRYGFSISMDIVKVAVNDRFVTWETLLHEGDHVVFIPPVSGG